MKSIREDWKHAPISCKDIVISYILCCNSIFILQWLLQAVNLGQEQCHEATLNDMDWHIHIILIILHLVLLFGEECACLPWTSPVLHYLQITPNNLHGKHKLYSSVHCIQGCAELTHLNILWSLKATMVSSNTWISNTILLLSCTSK